MNDTYDYTGTVFSPAIFDYLEGLAEKIERLGNHSLGQSLRAGFARGTGGVDAPYVLAMIVAIETELTEDRESDDWERGILI